MRAAVVYNPVKVELRALRRAVQAAQPGDWNDALWIETEQHDAGLSAARQAVDAGVDVVLAAGGDGTVRAVAEALAGTGVPLALVPSGTGNLLARNLGVDVNFLRTSVRGAFEGRDRDIDMAWAELERPNGERTRHAFVVMAGFGLDAEMIHLTDAHLKRRVGWLAYIDAARRALKRVDRVRMQYLADDGRRAGTVSVNTLIVGNCGVLQGNVVLLPEARIDDGRLDVALVRPDDVFGWLQVVGAVLRQSSPLDRALRRSKVIGAAKPKPTLGYDQISRFDVRLDDPRHVQIDGDTVGQAVAMRFTVDHGTLRMRVPRSRFALL